MPVRCHAKHDGHGIVLSSIKCIDDAVSLRCFFGERGAAAIVCESDANQDCCRVLLPGISIGEFARLIAGSNIELI